MSLLEMLLGKFVVLYAMNNVKTFFYVITTTNHSLLTVLFPVLLWLLILKDLYASGTHGFGQLGWGHNQAVICFDK